MMDGTMHRLRVSRTISCCPIQLVGNSCELQVDKSSRCCMPPAVRAAHILLCCCAACPAGGGARFPAASVVVPGYPRWLAVSLQEWCRAVRAASRLCSPGGRWWCGNYHTNTTGMITNNLCFGCCADARLQPSGFGGAAQPIFEKLMHVSTLKADYANMFRRLLSHTAP